MPLPAWSHDAPLVTGPPIVSALDAGLRSGIGVFETLRAAGTATLAADQHVERLVAGAQRVGIVLQAERVEAALSATLAMPRSVDEVAVRITVTAGPVTSDAWPAVPEGDPTLLITLHPAPTLPLPAVSAATVAARRWPADVKSTSYLASVLAQREAARAGADVAVLVDDDELLETAEGNLIALIDGALMTAADDGRMLPGVTRGLVLEEARQRGIDVVTGPLRHHQVAEAEALLVTSAVSGVRTVHTFDGRLIAGSDRDGAPHQLVTTLRSALDARRR